jgi:hypothetical protein
LIIFELKCRQEITRGGFAPIILSKEQFGHRDRLHMAPKDFPIGNLDSIEIIFQSEDDHFAYMMKILPITLTTNGMFERLNRLVVRSITSSCSSRSDSDDLLRPSDSAVFGVLHGKQGIDTTKTERENLWFRCIQGENDQLDGKLISFSCVALLIVRD